MVPRRRWLATGLFWVVAMPGPVGQAFQARTTTPGREFAVVAYLPDYRLDRVDPRRAVGVTDLVYFSIEARDNGSVDARRLSDRALKMLKRFKQENGTRVHVAVGGWGRSGGFARLSQDARARGRLVADLVQLCEKHGLDGVDLDWEHPQNDAENAGYATLLAELKSAFTPRKLLLSAALADWQDPGPKAYQALDRIHVMAYDHDGPRHSTFDQARADALTFVNRGVPRSKLCLGLPFYGRLSTNSQVESSYADILAKDHPQASADEAGGFFFNGPDTIARKTRFAHDEGLGGVMIWELGQDASGKDSLLDAIRRASHQTVVPPESRRQP